MQTDPHTEYEATSTDPGEKPRREGAFASFHDHYNDLIVRALVELDVLIESLPDEYSEGYKLWRDMISCLKDGVDSLARQETPHSFVSFGDALNTFCLEGAVHLLFDLVGHEKDDAEKAAHFRMHVMRLIEVYQSLPLPSHSENI